jgi:hypothetical protein
MRIIAGEIPPEWKNEIEGIAQDIGKTSEEVVREALTQYLSQTAPRIGQLINANIVSITQLLVDWGSKHYNLITHISSFSSALTPVIESFEKLLHLLRLYTHYYSSPVPEIQQYEEEIDLEYLMEDLPKLLSSIKVGTERVFEIYQSCLNMFNRFCLDEVQAEVIREAIAQYLGKTVLLPKQLGENKTHIGGMVSGLRCELNHPIGLIVGNINFADIYAQDLLQLQTLYARYYSEPVPEIHDYAQAIEIKLLVEKLPNLIHTLKINSNHIDELPQHLCTLILLYEMKFI